MGIGKLHSIPAQLIKMRGGYSGFLSTKCLDVSIPQIIRQNKNNIGSLGEAKQIESGKEKESQEFKFHIISVKENSPYWSRLKNSDLEVSKIIKPDFYSLKEQTKEN